VIVGGNTVRQDNPQLTTHGVATPNPLRVVLSQSLDLPIEAQLWSVAEAPTLVLTLTGMRQTVQAQLRDRGVEVLELANLSPATVMEILGQRGMLSVLWECGGKLAAQAIAAGAVQKMIAFIAPKIIGGALSPSPVGDLGLEQMTQALALDNVQWRSLGPDLVVEGYLKSPTDVSIALGARVD
jgi:diaminohydroxyphosphoribosylaminopyrimidine deaminase/5-amino-6-(5-phosphoribosylamino)uracil reductase